MNVSDLQHFVRNMTDLLFIAQKKAVPEEVQKVLAALEPFKDEKVGKFADFLAALSAEYLRVGSVSLPAPAKKGAARQKGEPKQKAFTKNDLEQIQKAAATLTELCNRASDPTLDFAEINRETERVAKAFDKDGLIAVARAFGITERLPTKVAAQEKIHKRIAARKGTVDLVETISPGGGDGGWRGGGGGGDRLRRVPGVARALYEQLARPIGEKTYAAQLLCYGGILDAARRRSCTSWRRGGTARQDYRRLHQILRKAL